MLENKIKKLLEERTVNEKIDKDWRLEISELKEEVLNGLFESRFLEDKIFVLESDRLVYRSNEPIHPLINQFQHLTTYMLLTREIVKVSDNSSGIKVSIDNKEVIIWLSCYYTTEAEFDEMVEILGIKIDTVSVDERLTRMKEEMKIFEIMKKYAV